MSSQSQDHGLKKPNNSNNSPPINTRQSSLMTRYWINPSFQTKTILYGLSIAMIVIVSTCASVNYFFYDFIQKGYEINLPQGHQYFTFIEQQQIFMNRILAFLSAFLFIGILFSAILFSHRIAGPLYRLNKHMLSVAEGKVMARVKFRDRDFFKELADSYNAQYEVLTHNSIDQSAKRNPDQHEVS